MRRDTWQETVHGPGTDGPTSFDWLGMGGFNRRRSATGPFEKKGFKDKGVLLTEELHKAETLYMQLGL